MINLRFRNSLYFSTLALFSLVYILILFFHLRLVLLPLFCLLIGAGLSSLGKSKGIAFYTAIFPLLSGLGYFENHGLPFNYMVLPLLTLFGYWVGDSLRNRDSLRSIGRLVESPYLLFQSLIVVSFIFVLLRWSNLTIDLSAFFKDTPIAPNGTRLSFGIIFPFIFLLLFALSYIYYLYLKDERIENRVRIARFFLYGQSISVIISLAQNFLKLKLFKSHTGFNGLASDASSFGFLNSIALLISFVLIRKYHQKKIGGILFIVFLIGTLNGMTRTSFIVLFFIFAYQFFSISTREKIKLLAFLLVLVLIAVVLISSFSLDKKFKFIAEIKESLDHILTMVFGGDAEKALIKISQKRDLTWGYALNVIKQYPLSGIGVGNYLFWLMYEYHGQDYFHDFQGNLYFFISSPLGLIGLIFFLYYLVYVLRMNDRIGKFMILTLLFIMIFGSNLWISEATLGLWLVLILNADRKARPLFEGNRFYPVFSGGLVVLFLLSQLISFQSLHPKLWADKTNTNYEYGFWYPEKNDSGTYRWSKERSGILLKLDAKGESRKIRVFCGAPLDRLANGKQTVTLYWKGQRYKTLSFEENRDAVVVVKAKAGEEGFLEFRTDPTFNLRLLGISPETRDLGIQVYE